MHPDTKSSQVSYQWPSSEIHDVISPCASDGVPPLSSTIDMTRSLEEQKQAGSSSSSGSGSAFTQLFRRVSNAMHGNTATVAQDRQPEQEYDEKEREQPPSPVSTAVDEENEHRDEEHTGRFYLNQNDQSLNQENGSSSSSPSPPQRRSAKSCLVAIFMITVGTLLALAFILIGLGKALSAKDELTGTTTSSVIPTPSISSSYYNSMSSSSSLLRVSATVTTNTIRITLVPTTT
ncbi:hypothetical protein BDA99DRAFT_540237 [Phascolomyces articulosus]|uniref:Uncharacterized protein n=1 Tax=Phascolomyces articulosus TaxID=60185 RepID=A0AAD5PB89_9FUNG|nr:hypothetical protein BDA99DRAFT_540237 [Phascolomyces articulosus]